MIQIEHVAGPFSGNARGSSEWKQSVEGRKPLRTKGGAHASTKNFLSSFLNIVSRDENKMKD